jgi:hypothetical protein
MRERFGIGKTEGGRLVGRPEDNIKMDNNEVDRAY